MCRHMYDWNIVNCDVKQPIHLTSVIIVQWQIVLLVDLQVSAIAHPIYVKCWKYSWYKAKQNKCWVSPNIAKKVRVGINFFFFLNFIHVHVCYFMKYWLKCSFLTLSIRPHQNCSMASGCAVAIRWYNTFILSFQLCINQFANKLCRAGGNKIGSVGLAETQHFFFWPEIKFLLSFSVHVGTMFEWICPSDSPWHLTLCKYGSDLICYHQIVQSYVHVPPWGPWGLSRECVLHIPMCVL